MILLYMIFVLGVFNCILIGKKLNNFIISFIVDEVFGLINEKLFLMDVLLL